MLGKRYAADSGGFLNFSYPLAALVGAVSIDEVQRVHPLCSAIWHLEPTLFVVGRPHP